MKKILFATNITFASFANAQAPSPRDLFENIGLSLMQKTPEIAEFEVCIESQCDTFYQSDIPRRVNPGAAADPSTTGSTVADAVNDIVGNAAKSLGIGGKIVVDYEKKADGSVKVKVEASFGTGAGAAAGAAGSNPDNPNSK